MIKMINNKREFEYLFKTRIRDYFKYFLNRLFKIIDKKYIEEKNKFIGDYLFETVMIETINLCNNNCSFCPVGFDSKTKPKKYLSIELVNKIANELSDLNFSGRISLYNNNEPLMDERLEEIIQIFRDKVPNSLITILTNGILLKETHLNLFNKGLNKLAINNYNNEAKLIRPISNFISKYNDTTEENKKEMNIEVIYRNKYKELSNRAGNNKNKIISDNLYLDKPCFLPHKQLVILGDGNVALCCNDLYGKFSLGNISKNSILEIWNGDKYREVRFSLLKFNSRPNISLCSNCDYIGLKG